MKLELKHLAPYLPYGLEIINNVDKKRELTIEYLNYWNESTIEIKPILRPLSDYTEDYANFWNYSFRDFKWEIKNKQVSVLCWQDLLSKHYDVFGLIEAGLAIDINTLNK